MPLTSIIPLEKDSAEQIIEREEHIIYNDSFYKHYLESPKYNSFNKVFGTCIRFECKKPFYWKKKNTYLQQWLQNEKILLLGNASLRYCFLLILFFHFVTIVADMCSFSSNKTVFCIQNECE